MQAQISEVKTDKALGGVKPGVTIGLFSFGRKATHAVEEIIVSRLTWWL